MFRFALSSLALVLALIGPSTAFAAPPFPLSDSDPQSPAFRARFLASYGVNAPIEPSFRPEDRVLYEAVAPWLTEDPARAIREVERALGTTPNPAFHFLLGNLHYETGNWDAAERALEQALAGFPDFRRAHRTLALIRLQQERYAESIPHWLKVITLGGGDAQSHGLLAYAYLAQKQYHSALTAYRMARMFRPESLDFRRGEAQCLLEMGELGQALALFDELIAEQPTVADHWLLQGNLYVQLERFPEAIATLEVAHTLGAGTVASRFLLGDLHLRTGQPRLARQHYAAAVAHPEFRPADVSRALRVLRHLVERGTPDDARPLLAALRPHLSDTLPRRDREQLVFTEARLALAEDRPDEATALLESLVAGNPLHADALILLAELAQQNAAWDTARLHLERALKIPERQVDALIALGRLEVQRGNFRAALKTLRQAYQREPRPDLKRYLDAIEAAAPGQGSGPGRRS